MNQLKIGDLTVKLPIVQGGMGVAISLSGLASVVANQGGIGVISAVGIGMTEPDYVKNFHEANIRALRKEIRKARSLSKGVIGVNIMLALTDYEDLIITSIEEKIDVIFMGAGLPLKIPTIIANAGLKNHNTKLVPKVSSAKAAKIIFRYWADKFNFIPDAVVVEGPLAGGHLGFTKNDLADNSITLSSLVEETVRVLLPFEEHFGKKIPVIAGGGINSGKNMYDIMQSGAQAVKLGTLFVPTYECDASPEFKKSYIACKKEDIVIIDSPVGLPGRVIKNDFVEQIMLGNTKPFKCPWRCLTTCNFAETPFCIAQALFNSAQGKMSEGFVFAGAKAYMVNKIRHVSEVIDCLISEYDIELQNKNNVPVFLNLPQSICSQPVIPLLNMY
jgi:NAD(P)H-dependent flavin oxidoreductase YrpB (nitropropane dioxygenase family)